MPAPDPTGPILASLQSTVSLTLFEGLPHQEWEAEELRKELAQKRTIQVRGFPFYQPSPVMKPDDAKTLAALLASPGAVRTHPPGVFVEHQCGGFHPDYALEWVDGVQVYQVLICFGCYEGRFYGAAGEVTCDIRETTLREIKAMLSPYGTKRPKAR